MTLHRLDKFFVVGAEGALCHAERGYPATRDTRNCQMRLTHHKLTGGQAGFSNDGLIVGGFGLYMSSLALRYGQLIAQTRNSCVHSNKSNFVGLSIGGHSLKFGFQMRDPSPLCGKFVG